MSGKQRSGINKKCLACGSEFYVPQYRAETAKFCSLNCQNHKQYEARRLIFKCFGCSAEVTDSPSRVGKRRKYCSIECKTKYALGVVETRRRQKAHRRLRAGGISGKTLRNWVFLEKPKKCENCGYSEYDFCIELHHIDNNPSNNVINNIAVLCVICHRKLHKGLLVWPSSTQQSPKPISVSE